MAAENLVRIRCISDRQPWTDERPLANGEVADVPAEVAAALKKAKLAEDAKGAALGLPKAEAEDK